jgi:hypothetical protein
MTPGLYTIRNAYAYKEEDSHLLYIDVVRWHVAYIALHSIGWHMNRHIRGSETRTQISESGAEFKISPYLSCPNRNISIQPLVHILLHITTSCLRPKEK